MPGPESTLEKKVCKTARDMGIYVRKMVAPSHAGFPDRMFLYLGDVLFIEFKRPGNKPTPLQAREIHELMTQGACATWVDSHGEAVELLARLKDGLPLELYAHCKEKNKRGGEDDE